MKIDIDKVIGVLKRGGIVAIPTDTLYALCVDATNKSAVEKLYLLKKRELQKSLPIFLPGLEEAKKYCEFDSLSLRIADKYWPGQLSIVLRKLFKPKHEIFVNNVNDTLMVRVPNDEFLLELLKSFNKPITGTSANISGEKNLLTHQEITNVFSDIDYVVPAIKELHEGAKPSTIVSCLTGKLEILREGVILEEDLLSL